MKSIKRLSNILKVTGIVLVLLSLTLGIYILAANGANRNMLLEQMRQSGVETNLIDSVNADTVIYRAMAEAVKDKSKDANVRARELAPLFEGIREQCEKATGKVHDAQAENVITYFDQEFDAAAFAEVYAQAEDQSEARELAEAFEYLDSFQAVPPKAGKKVAALKPVSCADAVKEYYDKLVGEHGEETGSYIEFVETLCAMIRDTVDRGETVITTKDYLNKNFDYTVYTAKLPEIRSAEKAEEQGNLLDSFAELAAMKAAGESVNYEAFFQKAYADLSARYPDEKMPGFAGFLTTMRGLLQKADYDGTPVSTMAALRTTRENEDKDSVDTRLADYRITLVQSADDQSPLPGFSVVWEIVSSYLIFFAVGVILIVLAKVLTVILTRRLLAKREAAGIQEDPDVLLRVEHLKQYFRSGDYVNRAVDDISFFVKKGEVFGLVGESGCGKTTTGRTIINLYDPTEGDVYFQGLRISSTQNGMPVLVKQLRNDHKAALTKLKEQLKEQIAQEPEKKAELTATYKAKVKKMNGDLAAHIAKVRDNALESSVEKSKCVEMYREKRKAELTAAYEEDCKKLTGKELEERKNQYEIEMKVAAKDNIMTRMQMIFQDPIASINPRMTVREIIAEGLVIRGIKDKAYIDKKVNEMLELVGLVPEHADRYPHEFSGGQRQRIGIARAIVMEPDLIIADEPISALDVSIQAQVINLMNDLRNKMGLTILFIAHNLSVVKYFSDRIAVMYFGRIMELTTSDELFEHPLHPYTKSLLSAIPYPDPHYEKQRVRIEYNPAKAHDYSVDKPSLREITPGHYIHCNDAELAQYKKELGL